MYVVFVMSEPTGMMSLHILLSNLISLSSTHTALLYTLLLFSLWALAHAFPLPGPLPPALKLASYSLSSSQSTITCFEWPSVTD